MMKEGFYEASNSLIAMILSDCFYHD